MTQNNLIYTIIHNKLEGMSLPAVKKSLIKNKIISNLESVDVFDQLIKDNKIELENDKVYIKDKIVGIVEKSKYNDEYFVRSNGITYKVDPSAGLSVNVNNYVVGCNVYRPGNYVAVAKTYADGKNISGTVENLNDKLYFVPFENNADKILIGKTSFNLACLDQSVCAIVYNNNQDVEINSVFGPKTNLHAITKALYTQIGLSKHFSQKTMQEVEKIPQIVTNEQKNNRYDMRTIPFICVDPASCKDKDDAIYAEKTKDGGHILMVAIAGVADYVLPNTNLYKESFSRGISKYIANDVIPMLPPELSNGICSLTDGKDRLAYVHRMKIEKNGECSAWNYYPAVINTKYNMNYKKMQEIKDNPINKDSTLCVLVNDLYDATSDIYNFKQANGMLDLNILDTDFIYNDDGVVEKLEKDKSKSHKVIEMAMIKADECVGLFFKNNNISSLYRVHELKTDDKISLLGEKLELLGYPNFLKNVQSKQNEDNSIKKVHELKRVINKAVKHEDDHITNLILKFAFASAKYSPVNNGHIGVGAIAHTHATAPIRRMPDLLIQQQLKDIIEVRKNLCGQNHLNMSLSPDEIKAYKSSPQYLSLNLTSLCEMSNKAEKKSEAIEFTSKNILISEYAKNFLNKRLPSRIIDIIDGGLVAQTEENFNVFIPGMQTGLGPNSQINYYATELRQYLNIKNRIKLGDKKEVKIIKVNTPTGEVIGSLINSNNKNNDIIKTNINGDIIKNSDIIKLDMNNDFTKNSNNPKSDMNNDIVKNSETDNLNTNKSSPAKSDINNDFTKNSDNPKSDINNDFTKNSDNDNLNTDKSSPAKTDVNISDIVKSYINKSDTNKSSSNKTDINCIKNFDVLEKE